MEKIQNIDKSWINIIRVAIRLQFGEICDMNLEQGGVICPGTVKVVKKFVSKTKGCSWNEFIKWCKEEKVHKITKLKIQDGVIVTANSEDEIKI